MLGRISAALNDLEDSKIIPITATGREDPTFWKPGICYGLVARFKLKFNCYSGVMAKHKLETLRRNTPEAEYVECVWSAREEFQKNRNWKNREEIL